MKLTKATEIKEGDVVTSLETGCNFTVITNHIFDVLFLVNEDVSWYSGIHLFYNDEIDVEFAKDTFNIDLRG